MPPGVHRRQGAVGRVRRGAAAAPLHTAVKPSELASSCTWAALGFSCTAAGQPPACMVFYRGVAWCNFISCAPGVVGDLQHALQRQTINQHSAVTLAGLS